METDSSLLLWRLIVLYYDTAQVLSYRSLSNIIRLCTVERNMCCRSEKWVAKMLFRCILGLKTGFLKMLLTFLRLHRYVNNWFCSVRLSSKSLSRSVVLAVLSWCLLSLFLHGKCLPIQAGVAQCSRRLEHGLEVQGLVVPFQAGSRDPYLLERANCRLASVQRQGRERYWSSRV